MQKKLLYSIIVLIALASCSPEPAPDARRLGLEFFPLQTGLQWIYDVETADYVFGDADEFRQFQLKIEIADSFFLGEELRYIAYSYTRDHANAPWLALGSLQLYRNMRVAVKVENNSAVQKLSFPIQEGRTWDGNALNTAEPEDFFMRQVFRPFILKQDTFDVALTVVQADNNDSIIFLDRRLEVYAKDIGLVYKEFSNISFCAEISCLGLGQIDFGNSFIWTLHSFSQQNF
jgi:hypothetical protein